MRYWILYFRPWNYFRRIGPYNCGIIGIRDQCSKQLLMLMIIERDYRGPNLRTFFNCKSSFLGLITNISHIWRLIWDSTTIDYPHSKFLHWTVSEIHSFKSKSSLKNEEESSFLGPKCFWIFLSNGTLYKNLKKSTL